MIFAKERGKVPIYDTYVVMEEDTVRSGQGLATP